MAQGDEGCLKGVLIGCAGLLVLLLAAGAFGYYKVVRPMTDRVERMAEVQEESTELRQRLEELNATHDFDVPEDPSEAVLDADDVDRYLAVRSALTDELEAFLQVGRQIEGEVTAGEGGFSQIGEMFGSFFRGFEETAQARLALQRAAVDALEAQEMSPRELAFLLHLVEWRFLGRPEAAFFGLSEFERDLYLETRLELMAARRTLTFAERFDAEVNGQDVEELRARVVRLEERLTGFEGEAEGTRELHPRTRALLEEHREALEDPGPEGIFVLATLTEQEVTGPPVEGAGG